MKKFLGVVLSMALAVSTAVAGDAAKPNSKSGAKQQTITGYLVDVACASENASHPEPGFAARHDKSCLQMPECAKSGYAILTDDDKVVKLDKESSEHAKKLIAATNKKDNWKVSATGVLSEEGFAAHSLKLR